MNGLYDNDSLGFGPRSAMSTYLLGLSSLLRRGFCPSAITCRTRTQQKARASMLYRVSALMISLPPVHHRLRTTSDLLSRNRLPRRRAALARTSSTACASIPRCPTRWPTPSG